MDDRRRLNLSASLPARNFSPLAVARSAEDMAAGSPRDKLSASAISLGEALRTQGHRRSASWGSQNHNNSSNHVAGVSPRFLLSPRVTAAAASSSGGRPPGTPPRQRRPSDPSRAPGDRRSRNWGFAEGLKPGLSPRVARALQSGLSPRVTSAAAAAAAASSKRISPQQAFTSPRAVLRRPSTASGNPASHSTESNSSEDLRPQTAAPAFGNSTLTRRSRRTRILTSRAIYKDRLKAFRARQKAALRKKASQSSALSLSSPELTGSTSVGAEGSSQSSERAGGAFKAWWNERKVQLQLQSEPIGADAAALAVAKFSSPQHKRELLRLAVDTGVKPGSLTTPQHANGSESVRHRQLLKKVPPGTLLSSSLVQRTFDENDNDDAASISRQSDWTGGIAVRRIPRGGLSESMRPQQDDQDSWIGPFDGSLRPGSGGTGTRSANRSPADTSSPRASAVDVSFNLSTSFNDSSSYSDSEVSQRMAAFDEIEVPNELDDEHSPLSQSQSDEEGEYGFDVPETGDEANKSTPGVSAAAGGDSEDELQTSDRSFPDDALGQPLLESEPSPALQLSDADASSRDRNNTVGGQLDDDFDGLYDGLSESSVDDLNADNIDQAGHESVDDQQSTNTYDAPLKVSRNPATSPIKSLRLNLSKGQSPTAEPSEQGGYPSLDIHHDSGSLGRPQGKSHDDESLAAHQAEYDGPADSFDSRDVPEPSLGHGEYSSRSQSDKELYRDGVDDRSLSDSADQTVVRSSRRSHIQLGASARSNVRREDEFESSHGEFEEYGSQSASDRDSDAFSDGASEDGSPKDAIVSDREGEATGWSQDSAQSSQIGETRGIEYAEDAGIDQPAFSSPEQSPEVLGGWASEHDDEDEDDEYGSDIEPSTHNQHVAPDAHFDRRFVALGETDALISGLFPAGTAVLVTESVIVPAAEAEGTVAGKIVSVYDNQSDALYDVKLTEDATLSDGSRVEAGLLLKQVHNSQVRPDFSQVPNFDDSYDSNEGDDLGVESDATDPRNHGSEEYGSGTVSPVRHHPSTSKMQQASPRIKLDLFVDRNGVRESSKINPNYDDDISDVEVGPGEGSGSSFSSHVQRTEAEDEGAEIYSHNGSEDSALDEDYLAQASDTRSHLGNSLESSLHQTRESQLSNEDYEDEIHSREAGFSDHFHDWSRKPSGSGESIASLTASRSRSSPRSLNPVVSPSRYPTQHGQGEGKKPQGEASSRVKVLAQVSTGPTADVDFDSLIETMLEQGQITFKKIQKIQTHIESGRHTKEHYVRKWKKKLARLAEEERDNNQAHQQRQQHDSVGALSGRHGDTKQQSKKSAALIAAELAANRAQTPRARKLNELNLTNRSRQSSGSRSGDNSKKALKKNKKAREKHGKHQKHHHHHDHRHSDSEIRDIAKETPAESPSAQEPAEPLYGCDYNCGFQGSFNVVSAHEEACALAPHNKKAASTVLPRSSTTDNDSLGPSESQPDKKQKKKKKDKKKKKSKKETENSALPAALPPASQSRNISGSNNSSFGGSALKLPGPGASRKSPRAPMTLPNPQRGGMDHDHDRQQRRGHPDHSMPVLSSSSGGPRRGKSDVVGGHGATSSMLPSAGLQRLHQQHSASSLSPSTGRLGRSGSGLPATGINSRSMGLPSTSTTRGREQDKQRSSSRSSHKDLHNGTSSLSAAIPALSRSSKHHESVPGPGSSAGIGSGRQGDSLSSLPVGPSGKKDKQKKSKKKDKHKKSKKDSRRGSKQKLSSIPKI